MKDLAVYLHVPFCKKKCAYCDFASFAGCEAQWAAYFEALGGEIDAWAPALSAYRVRSVFFGGGTPSLVPAAHIVGALDRLRAAADFAPDVEITLEANPGTLDAPKLDAYRAAGVNRLSVGVQSFDAALLKSLGRIHTPEQAERALWLAHAAGFENLSVDLMYALPGQTREIWLDTLERALELPIRHLSAYGLIVEDGTEMARRVARGEARVPDEDAVNEMQRAATRRLRAAGFERYEISNYARPGCESRHNLAYWTDGEYLGLGSAAHSLMDDARFSNPPELERYLAGVRALNRCVRTTADRREETLMLATRTARGLDLRAWRQAFGEDFLSAHAREIAEFERRGLIGLRDGFLRLTDAGMELQDALVLAFMD